MLKIEEGMYVRFNDLTNYNKNNIVMIDKIKFISEVMCGLEETLSITFEKYNEDVLKKDIIKASYSIIDLIEVGDYVNGYKVLEIVKGFKVIVDNLELNTRDGNYYLKRFTNNEIKSIVTKEVFKANEYRMETD